MCLKECNTAMERDDISIQSEGETLLAVLDEGGSELLVFNDDYHTFDFVIECLQMICKLNKKQAVTCTNIIHYKGLCVVKHGSYDELKQMCSMLLQQGLKAEVR
jgi:ATP-dependent Clp protease adaptor protein ClpS